MSFSTSYDYSKPAEDAEVQERNLFIKRVYTHLAFAILGLGLVEAALLRIEFTRNLGMKILQGGGMLWLVVLGVFAVVGYMADKFAHSSVSKGTQYAGLALYVVAEAFILLPVVLIAQAVMGGTNELIIQAFLITGGIFAALTFVALTTKKDFSFLGGFLKIGGIAILVTIVASLIFGWNLGVYFSGFMVLFIGAVTLYQTSKILREYPTDYYVGASLGLFASFATMLFYVLRILIALQSND